MQTLGHTRYRSEIQCLYQAVVVFLGHHNCVAVLGSDIYYVAVGDCLIHIFEKVFSEVGDVCIRQFNHLLMYMIAYIY